MPFKHPRIYYPDLPDKGKISLTGDKYFHLARSVRARPGDKFRLFNGDGHFADAEILSIDSESISAQITKFENADNTPSVKLTLAFGLLPPDPLKILIAGATQVGVSEFIPFQSTFNDLHISENALSKTMDRWQKLIIENSAIASRSHLPRISEPVKLEDIIEISSGFSNRFTFWEEGGEDWRKYLPLDFGKVMVVIGPKGGLNEKEITMLKDADYKILTLGELILKAEFAAISACARIIGR